MSKGLMRLDEVRPEHVEWIWAERIARTEIHFIAGRPDVGKGLIATKIAADISQGRDPFTNDIVQRPMNILYSAREDSYGSMTRPRLEAQGANRQNIHLHRFRLPMQFEEMADIVVDKNIDLIVIDPLASHLSGGINRGSDNVRQVTDPLKELLEATGAACLVIDHTIKHVSRYADPITAVGGASSGFPAACRMGFLYGPDPGDDERRVLACIKHNIREKPMAMAFELDSVEVRFEFGDDGEVYENDSVPKLILQGEDYYNPVQLVTGDRQQIGRGRPAERRSDACEWLTRYLWDAMNGVTSVGYPTSSEKIKEDALQRGMSFRTLRRAADDMKIVKSGKGGNARGAAKWALPKNILEMLVGEVDDVASDPSANPTAENAEVAEYIGEEPALKNLLDQGSKPYAMEDEDLERNKAPEDIPNEEPDKLDGEIADLLASFADPKEDEKEGEGDEQAS